MRIRKHYANFYLHNEKNMDNNLILNRIKKHYNLGSNVQLAKKLGINTSTLSGWANKRGIGNWELIFEKCNDIDFNWLINGQKLNLSIHNANTINEPLAHYAIEKECPECKHKERLIQQLQKENERLWKLIEGNKSSRNAV